MKPILNPMIYTRVGGKNMTTSPVAKAKFWRTTAIFTILWGGLIGVMIALPLFLKGHRSPHDMQLVLIICVFGGSISAFLTRIISRWLVSTRRKSARFAATIILLSVGTVATTSLMFTMQFRTYFAQWHQTTFTTEWVFQLLFTSAYSSYLFGSTALHSLISPMNVAILILCAWIFEPQR